MTNARRELARLRTRKPPPGARDELPPISHTSRAADVVRLQRFVGNRRIQDVIAKGRLLHVQMPGGNRSRSTAVQRSADACNTCNDDDRVQLSRATLTPTEPPSLQRADGLDEEWGINRPMTSDDITGEGLMHSNEPTFKDAIVPNDRGIDEPMKSNGLTDEELLHSNEPSFKSAIDPNHSGTNPNEWSTDEEALGGSGGNRDSIFGWTDDWW
jgi:hypothetical protein